MITIIIIHFELRLKSQSVFKGSEFRLSSVFQNNMRGKFTRGNTQEFRYQIRSHSETEQIRTGQ